MIAGALQLTCHKQEELLPLTHLGYRVLRHLTKQRRVWGCYAFLWLCESLGTVRALRLTICCSAPSTAQWKPQYEFSRKRRPLTVADRS